jgi:predicted RNA binding protein YcfA (HicA-like mRNA interferase family)
MGFDERIKGSHHIYRKQGVEEKINLQKEGSHAKPYQVRQVRRIILQYKLTAE